MSDKRKLDHINLAFKSVPKTQTDLFSSYYEPILSAHPEEDFCKTNFLKNSFGMPLWVSSMTGGTEKALIINQNLARACNQFQLGMGLGSCRPLLESSSRFDDFNMRPYIGDALLFTNFGIAQVEQLLDEGNLNKIFEITNLLKANGVVIHVNPLQEWAQEEGDKFKYPPIDTIKKVVEKSKFPIIVKEVGQGFGPLSIRELLKLPLAAIELAGYGGTNFTLLEQARLNGSNSVDSSSKSKFGNIGHSAAQMIDWINQCVKEGKTECSEIIISGGIKDAVTAQVLMNSLELNSVVGMASELLKYSMKDYSSLEKYLVGLKGDFNLSKAFIRG